MFFYSVEKMEKHKPLMPEVSRVSSENTKPCFSLYELNVQSILLASIQDIDGEKRFPIKTRLVKPPGEIDSKDNWNEKDRATVASAPKSLKL